MAKHLGIATRAPDNDALTQSLINAYWTIRPSAEPGMPVPLSEIRAYRLELNPPFTPDELINAIQAMDALFLEHGNRKGRKA
ncbi:MAG TPA: hypothetical protein VFM75_11405 [Modicisalibacter sp.]|nr:hypothetical protein [Modicisalibacter sp.]